MSLQNNTLADRAYRRVEEMIVTLELSPGQLISESELSRHLDIGRTPLREALQRLADDQLVKVLPRKGILIAEIQLRDHLALLQTRRVLDRLVARQAARRARPDRRETLRSCAADMHAAAEAGRLDEFMRVDRQFDELLTEAARNRYAADALSPLHAHCRRFWYKFEADGDLPHAAELHERLMRAVAAADENDAVAASDALIDYLQQFTRSVLEPA